MFHCKLHSIKEPTPPRKSNSWMIFSRTHFVFVVIAGIIFVSISLTIFNFEDSQDRILLHVYLLFNIAILFIILPRYYISQNHNLKLYLSVYHQIPPPVLPWQLPENFDPNSVKLEFILYDNE